ncbi:hypothetical protein AAG570_007504 [Ranatra chinensis]|uniref:Myb-like domain-containing protein n=1 Tax=Ranatra chinensis TaxID=642074 RepID=A0ABD0YEK6_9HEMI
MVITRNRIGSTDSERETMDRVKYTFSHFAEGMIFQDSAANSLTGCNLPVMTVILELLRLPTSLYTHNVPLFRTVLSDLVETTPQAPRGTETELIFSGGGDDEEGCNAEGTWTGEATRLLLSTVEDLLPKVGTSPQLKTQTKMWAHVAQNIMKRHSYTFTDGVVVSMPDCHAVGPGFDSLRAIQCQNRWKTLVRGYKRRIKTGGNPVSSGATLRTYHYYERKLEDILSKKSVLSAPRGNAEDAKLGEDCGVGDVKVSPLPGDTSSVASSTIEDEDDDAGVGRGCGGGARWQDNHRPRAEEAALAEGAAPLQDGGTR